MKITKKTETWFGQLAKYEPPKPSQPFKEAERAAKEFSLQAAKAYYQLALHIYYDKSFDADFRWLVRMKKACRYIEKAIYIHPEMFPAIPSCYYALQTRLQLLTQPGVAGQSFMLWTKAQEREKAESESRIQTMD